MKIINSKEELNEGDVLLCGDELIWEVGDDCLWRAGVQYYLDDLGFALLLPCYRILSYRDVEKYAEELR